MPNFIKEEAFLISDHETNQLINPIINSIDDKLLKKELLDFFTNSIKKFVYDIVAISETMTDKKIDKRNGQKKFDALCSEIALKGNEIVKQKIKDKKIVKDIKQAFRSILKKLIYDNSVLVRRALEKPRGYPGDYGIIESNYNNTAVSEGIGGYFDRCFLNNGYAVAVRNRKDKMRDVLLAFIKTSKKESISIVDLGSGSAREVRELMPMLPKNSAKLNFTCIDFDEESLEFSKKELSNVPSGVKLYYLKENLVALFSNDDYIDKHKGTADMVYTIGFADYFLDTVLENLVRFSFGILSNNGVAAIAHKDIDADPVTPIYFDWFCDWKFVPRNQDQLIKIVKNSGIKNYSLSVEREKSGTIFFVKITKLSKGEK